ncbi:MAG: hypothetical protein CBE24_00385 [bacterium TMED264]|nr:MAG: hypothetical protein CBE24_00385 [bacterium TMED264]
MARNSLIADLPTGAAGALTNRNHIINGNFSVAQRGTSFTSTDSLNNDDTYTLDRWYIVSDGNDVIDVSQETSTIPTNGKYAISLDVETANKKFGIAQIIEGKNCTGLIGEEVTLSFKAKVSDTSKLDNVKAAIIAWSSTEDAVTSDVASAWGNEGTNPTLASNLTYENTPANLSVTTSYATYSVTATIDTSSTTNIIVFIWSDVTDTTAGHFLYITDVQLERGSNATPFENRSFSDELKRCKRYYERLDQNAGNANYPIATGVWYQSGETMVMMSYAQKRAAPSITSSSADFMRCYYAGGSQVTNEQNPFENITDSATRIVATMAGDGTSGQGAFCQMNTSSEYVEISAEL